MNEEEGRAAIVAEALTWLRTPYHHRAGLKGVGVDCAQLVLKIYANVGLIEDYDTGEYSMDWHIHRDIERYMVEVLKFGSPIPVSEAKNGDLILFKFVRVFSHGAIVVAPNQVIHALRNLGQVCLTDLDRDVELIDKEQMAFTYWPAVTPDVG